MLDILTRSIARAGGIELDEHLQVFRSAGPRRSILKDLIDAFNRWNVRRSTWLTLKEMDDRILQDIGLSRGMLYDVADQVGARAAANDNELPLALTRIAANGNMPQTQAG